MDLKYAEKKHPVIGILLSILYIYILLVVHSCRSKEQKRDIWRPRHFGLRASLSPIIITHSSLISTWLHGFTAKIQMIVTLPHRIILGN